MNSWLKRLTLAFFLAVTPTQAGDDHDHNHGFGEADQGIEAVDVATDEPAPVPAPDIEPAPEATPVPEVSPIEVFELPEMDFSGEVYDLENESGIAVPLQDAPIMLSPVAPSLPSFDDLEMRAPSIDTASPLPPPPSVLSDITQPPQMIAPEEGADAALDSLSKGDELVILPRITPPQLPALEPLVLDNPVYVPPEPEPPKVDEVVNADEPEAEEGDAATPDDAAPDYGITSYIVEGGDTLTDIAAAHYGIEDDGMAYRAALLIAYVNDITNADCIDIGDTVYLPSLETLQSASGSEQLYLKNLSSDVVKAGAAVKTLAGAAPDQSLEDVLILTEPSF